MCCKWVPGRNLFLVMPLSAFEHQIDIIVHNIAREIIWTWYSIKIHFSWIIAHLWNCNIFLKFMCKTSNFKLEDKFCHVHYKPMTCTFSLWDTDKNCKIYSFYKNEISLCSRREFPGSQPVSMDRSNLERLREHYYWVSWKADGIRYV